MIKQNKTAICYSVPKIDFSGSSYVPFPQVTFYRSISCVLLIDKRNKAAKTALNLKEMPYSHKKKLLKGKEKNIAPAKTNVPIS